MTATVDSTAPDGSEDAFPLDAQALLLDMDGTLIDSGPSVERAWSTMLREFGSEADFGHAMHGRPARQVIDELLPDLDEEQVAAAHARIEELEIADVAQIVTLPGTQRLLAELDAAAQHLGRPTWTIVTSCTMPLFEARWVTTGLPTPSGLVTADQVTSGKPDPEPYLLGARRLDVDPTSALVIEDSVGGLCSGAEAGSRTVAVTSTTPASVLRPLAHALVTSLDDLEARVEDDRLRIVRRGS